MHLGAVTFHLSSQRPALLTLQRDDLGHQHLQVHLLGEHPHGRVHQLGAEDGQELLPHGLPLAPFAGTGPLRAPGRAALGSLRGRRRRMKMRMRMGRMRMMRAPIRSRPVPLLLLLVMVLVLQRLAERLPADGVRAVSGEMRRSVGEVGLPLVVGQEVVVVVVGGRGGVRAAAARRSHRRTAEGVSEAVQVLQAPVGAPVLVLAPAVDGAQPGVQLLLGLGLHRGRAAVGRGPAAPLGPVGRPLAGALTGPPLLPLVVSLGLCSSGAAAAFRSQGQLPGHVLHQRQARSRHGTRAGRGQFTNGGVIPELVGERVAGLFASLGMVELALVAKCAFFSWEVKTKKGAKHEGLQPAWSSNFCFDLLLQQLLTLL